ncbi:Pentatricopeptide repeat-containing protein, partial [Durusdinium trenchii]
MNNHIVTNVGREAGYSCPRYFWARQKMHKERKHCKVKPCKTTDTPSVMTLGLLLSTRDPEGSHVHHQSGLLGRFGQLPYSLGARNMWRKLSMLRHTQGVLYLDTVRTPKKWYPQMKQIPFQNGILNHLHLWRMRCTEWFWTIPQKKSLPLDHRPSCVASVSRLRAMPRCRLSPTVVQYTQVLKSFTEEEKSTGERLFREMVEDAQLPTQVTLKVLRRLVGPLRTRRLLEDLDIDESSLEPLVTADAQKRRWAESALRRQEAQVRKRVSHLQAQK